MFTLPSNLQRNAHEFYSLPNSTLSSESRLACTITCQLFALSERKIDLIDNKLAKAIGLLEKLQVGGSSNESPQPAKTSWMSTETPLSLPTPASHSSQPRQARGQVVEGESSLTAHSAFANEFLQKVAATDSIQQSSPELSETLDELSDILTQQGAAIDEAPYPHARPIQPLKQPQCEMPPLKMAIALIRIAKGELADPPHTRYCPCKIPKLTS